MLKKLFCISFYIASIFMTIMVACYVLHLQKIDTLMIDLVLVGHISVYFFIPFAVSSFVFGAFYFFLPDYFNLRGK